MALLYSIGTCERRVFHVGVPDSDWMFRVPLNYLRILMQNGLVEQSSSYVTLTESRVMTLSLLCHLEILTLTSHLWKIITIVNYL